MNVKGLNVRGAWTFELFKFKSMSIFQSPFRFLSIFLLTFFPPLSLVQQEQYLYPRDPSRIKDPWHIDAARNSNNWGRLLSAKVFTPLSASYNPHLGTRCAPTPPQVLQQHLSLRRRTTGFPPVWRIYGCRRFSRDSCRVQWSPTIVVLISSVAIYLSLRTETARPRLSPERVVPVSYFRLSSRAESCARSQ